VVEGLPVTANQDIAVIPNKLRPVAIRNRRTTPTMPNTIRVNTPSKPERPCPYPNTLTLLSTFLTEQDDEDLPQISAPTPRFISRYSSPRQPAVSHNRTHVSRLPVSCSVSCLPDLFEIALFISNILFVPRASRIVAYTALTWFICPFW
jgi:hypothetical protein